MLTTRHGLSELMQQAEDYRTEFQTLASLLSSLPDSVFNQPTLFENWTINDVIGHLHMFDVGALKSLHGPEQFDEFFAPIKKALSGGKTFLEAQTPWLNGLESRHLFEAWQQTAQEVADTYAKADPKKRVKWAGPEMSARSSITARQMETWAHGQEIFDALGVKRVESDRIKNICHMGVSTFAWTFMNRQLPVPLPTSYVELIAPSGNVWHWNEVQEDNRIRGQAVDFARVVTQVRNVKDTSLVMSGHSADSWMQMAQCFAGPAVDPPAPGTRFRAWDISIA